MKGPQLWKKAKSIIPGGNQLLSKRSEKFLPELWPAYYKKAKGCEVWDIDGNHYFDFAQMGVGSCSLGYSDPDVNTAVMHAVSNGSMSSLNCPEEVALAEELLRIHPWAHMARFSRTGGEACAIAIRIARAHTGKDMIAFCGYHGWHDWYLSANIGNKKNLDSQLLPGLNPHGVPSQLRGTALPFEYNDLHALENIVKKYGSKIGCIIMEPQRANNPKKGFLKGVRTIAHKIGAVLIFDEVTSGFRVNFGGIHMKLGIHPDIAIFGKALGNGYPISAIIGRKKVMDCAQNTFISSTFWTERIGYAAALATLRKMKKNNVQRTLVRYGEMINAGWKKLAAKHEIDITLSGIPPLTHISFKGNDPLALQTLYTQEMLKKGYLLGASVYSTYAYTPEIINQFIDDSDSVFAMIKHAIHSNNPKKYLKADVMHAGFKRLA